ncbi:hypothetical protein GCM10022393_36080 [Aquimarina addita]|uniref:DUF304 domain-containing protein n=2 Tax=Aquimarina addita TaxID=870485 RepID=A0ABP6UQZ5_9FLAO
MLPAIIVILGMLFSETMEYDHEIFLFLLPGALYLLFVLLFVQYYFNSKVSNRVKSLVEYTLTIDEMVSKKVQKAFFNSLGVSSKLTEYYFLFYNKEYDKYIRVSTVAMQPSYNEVILKSWEHTTIRVFLDPKDINNSKKGKSIKK